MKEIVENGVTYITSESYPDRPYMKYIKNGTAIVSEPIDQMAELNKKIADLSVAVSKMQATLDAKAG